MIIRVGGQNGEYLSPSLSRWHFCQFARSKLFDIICKFGPEK
jgi:hypothetical protein